MRAEPNRFRIESEKSTSDLHRAREQRSRLKAFLAETHAHMPEVADAEVEEDIKAAITAVRQHL